MSVPSQPDENGLRSVFDAKTSRERSDRCQELVSLAFAGVEKTRGRQRLCRSFMLGRISAGVPDAIREAGIRHGDGRNQAILEYHAPQSLVWPLKQVADFASQRPQPMRHPVARARESAAVSSRIERIATGVMGQLWPYRQSCDPILLDSEAASIVVPSTAHWAAPIDQYDYLTQAEFQKLPDDLKELWWYEPPGDQGGGGNTQPGGYSNNGQPRYRSYSRKYQRDANGTPPWDDQYQPPDGSPGEPFTPDTQKSAEAVDAEIEERVKSKIPLQIDLLLPSQFAPVNPRWEGDRLTVDGIARREKMSGIDLYRRGYRWSPRGPAFTASPAMGTTAPVTLDTLLLQDGDGCPYLIYSVDGCMTWKSGDDQDYSEVLDLHDRYGFDFLPAVYQLGIHSMSENPDDWVIPFLYGSVTPQLMRDRLVAMNDFHVQNTSCGGWFVKIDPALQAVMPELAAKPEFRVKQMTATPVPGDVVPAVHPGAGPGLMVQKEMLDQDLAMVGANPNPDANSGIDRALIDRDEDRGLSMAWDGVDGLYEGTATNALRALACMARKLNKPITINVLTEMPDEDGTSPTRSTVVIDADMFGGDYRIVAWRPETWGSNPTKQAMIMQAQKDKQATFVEMREAVGDPSPLGTMAQIFIEDLLLNTPEGKQQVLAESAALNAEKTALERAKMRQQQMLNQDNVPMPAAAGVIDPSQMLRPDQPGQGQPAVTVNATPGGMPNPAQNQLNSVAGAPQAAVTNIAQQGGDASGLDFGGA